MAEATAHATRRPDAAESVQRLVVLFPLVLVVRVVGGVVVGGVADGQLVIVRVAGALGGAGRRVDRLVVVLVPVVAVEVVRLGIADRDFLLVVVLVRRAVRVPEPPDVDARREGKRHGGEG